MSVDNTIRLYGSRAHLDHDVNLVLPYARYDDSLHGYAPGHLFVPRCRSSDTHGFGKIRGAWKSNLTYCQLIGW